MKFVSSMCVIVFCVVCLPALARNSPPTGRKRAAPSTSRAADIAQGVRLFHENCGRCHNPPTDLSPREARAVVRQMRVRAMLSDKDERALLKLLAP
jgi:cytochrome c5